MTISTPRIGLSLNVSYLAGNANTAEQRLFGNAAAWLRRVAEHGVASIELRTVRAKTEPAEAVRALRQVWDAGLEATVHGTLPPIDADGQWPSTIPALVQVIEQLAGRGPAVPCPITLHAYTAADATTDLLQAQTIARLKSMTTWLDAQQAPVKLALELNRAKTIVDPSTTYQGVLAIHSKLDPDRIGVCWDFGHAYANVLNGLLQDAPPHAFLREVVHTHIHDLGPTGRTHWPLTEQRLPLADYVSHLLSTGYQGVWNLEYAFDRFADEDRIPERVFASVDRLTRTVHESCA